MANTSFRRGFYGIDLGTTHTVVVKATKEGSKWRYRKLKLPNMPISELDDVIETELLPSAVYYPRNGSPVVGLYAKEAIHFAPERVYINSKIDLGGSLRKDQSDEHTPLEVSTEILKVCFQAIVEDGGYNANVRISVPAAFSRDKRVDTENAAKQALYELGYSNLRLVRTTEEPYAALLNLVVNEKQFIDMVKKDRNTIMLIDIGGGTMDVIICDISYEGVNTLKARTKYEPAKHDEFAGARFDFELMRRFMEDFLNHYKIYDNQLPDKERIKLEKRMLLIAEDAKKFLCKKENSNRVYEWTLDYDYEHVTDNCPHFLVSLNKKKMDIILDGLLNSKEAYGTNQSIKRIIQKTLSDNGLTPYDIDCIYLTGGMANYDRISHTIKSLIRKPVIIAEEPLFCTAIGVALSLVIQSPDGETRLIYDSESNPDPNPDPKPVPIKPIVVQMEDAKRMGMSYFIDVENGMPMEIINKNETYPCNIKKANIQLKTTSQSRMSLILYEGHNEYDCNMKLLRKQIVEFDELIDIGTPIDISYKISPNKIITIFASIDGEPPFEFNADGEI